MYYLGGLNIITIPRTQEEQNQRKDDVMTEAEIGVMPFEDGGRGHKPRKTSSSISLKREGNGFSPSPSRRDATLPVP